MEWPMVAALAAVGGLLLSAAAFYGGWVVSRKTGEDAAASAKSAHARIDALAKELGDFKAEVARDYATNRLVAEMRSEVVGAINRLADRIDRAFERVAKD